MADVPEVPATATDCPDARGILAPPGTRQVHRCVQSLSRAAVRRPAMIVFPSGETEQTDSVV